MKRILFWISVFCFSSVALAQSQSSRDYGNTLEDMGIPQDSVTHVMLAYTELEPQLLADIDWLNYTPVKDKKDIRQEKSRFVLMWMSGSPTVSIKIDDRIMKFSGARPWALLAYMTGWTKYSIENDYSIDQVKCTVAAINNMVAFYKRNKADLDKDKEVERLAKMVENKTLENHVRTVLGW